MTNESNVQLHFASSEADRQAAFDVRMAVFVEEQTVPPEEEADDQDDIAIHLLAEADGSVVATSRLVVLENGLGLIGRVAVLPDWRRMGIADQMLDTLESKAREIGLLALELHAQTYVQDLYEKHGFRVTSSEPYTEAGLEHVTMAKTL
ncbi:MAG: GNAT family N-acetyltransferase [Dehalococcoidia bacterium]